MNAIFLSIITLGFLVAVTVFIIAMLEIRNASRTFREFVKTTDSNIKPILDELQESLKSIRKAADGITDISKDLEGFSASMRRTGENIKKVADIIEEITSSATIKVFSIRAGIRATLETLFKNLLTRG